MGVTVGGVTGRDVEELKRRLGRVERNAAGKRQFDDELRQKVIAYVRARVATGVSQTQATKELGLEQRTVWGWMRAKSRALVRKVEVIEPRVAEALPERTFEVRFPSGARIDGLTLDDVATLLRRSS